jgi:4-amino-4-deoxy-L-arabinose transferase-like glycosyltransferase
MNKILKNSWCLLLLIIAFHIINNKVILSLDQTFPVWDELENLREASYISRTFTTVLNSPQKVYPWYYDLGHGCRAPLYRIILSLACDPKINEAGIFVINSLFFIILLLSVYGIGSKLQNSPSGVLAAFILSMFTGVFAMSRVSMLDLPLAAMVSLSVYLMLLTKNFTNLKYSLLFGISVGLGMLIKVTYINFLLPTAVFYIFQSVVKNLRQNANGSIMARNLIICLSCSLLIGGSWYFPNLKGVMQRAHEVCYLSPQLKQDGFGTVLSRYANWLFFDSVGPFFCVLSFVGVFLCLIKRQFALLFIWFLIPLSIFSLSPNYVPRFMLPLLPAMSLFIALGVATIRTSWIRKMLVMTIVVYGVSSFFLISYGKTYSGPVLKREVKREGSYGARRVDYGIIYPLRNVNWKIDEIANLILGRDSRYKKNVNIGLMCLSVPNVPEISNALRYYALCRGAGFKIACPAELDVYDSQYKLPPFYLSEFDFIITKDGNQGDISNNLSWTSDLSNLIEQHKNDFDLVGCVQGLPDGSEACVWGNKNAAGNKIP